MLNLLTCFFKTLFVEKQCKNSGFSIFSKEVARKHLRGYYLVQALLN